MARSSVPLDICLEIAQLAATQTLPILARVSKIYCHYIRPLLYRHIAVGNGAELLVSTLATEPLIALLVRRSSSSFTITILLTQTRLRSNH